MEPTHMPYYFAYGLYMHPEVLREALPALYSATVIGRAYLPGFQVVYARETPEAGGALPIIARHAAGRVWGVLYQVSEEAMSTLDKLEGVALSQPWTLRKKRTVYSYAPQLFSTKPEQLLDEQLYKNPQRHTKSAGSIQLFESYVMVDSVWVYESRLPSPVSKAPSASCLQTMIEATRLHKIPQRYTEELRKLLEQAAS